MNLVLFYLMPYAELDLEAGRRHGTVWVHLPNKHFDPEKGHRLYNRYLDELVTRVENGSVPMGARVRVVGPVTGRSAAGDVGYVSDDRMAGSVKVTVIATGFDRADLADAEREREEEEPRSFAAPSAVFFSIHGSCSASSSS